VRFDKRRPLSIALALPFIIVHPLSLAGQAADSNCGAHVPTFEPFDPDRLSEHARILATDAFEGREPGSKGETLTIRYVTQQFAAAGLKPAGDKGQWTQMVPLRRFTLGEAAKIQVRSGAGVQNLQHGVDWAGASLANAPEVQIKDAPIVFVGYGARAPERGWDDYKGIDLRGKVAVYLINDPDFEAPQPGKFGGKAMTYYGRWTYKFEEAARQGAIAALIVHEDAPASYGWATVRNSWGAPQFDIVRDDARRAHPLFEGWLQRGAAIRLFDQAGMQFEQIKQRAMRADFSPVELKNTSMAISARIDIHPVQSHNVVGWLPGHKRPQESVIYSAHWDHIGVGAPDASGDRIYNGAMDNATGVAGLLELARVFAKARTTERSLLFIAFTAEEKAFLGSKYYVQHPLRTLERTAAVFNMDIFNPYGPACDVQPWGTNQNSLEDDLAEAARREGRVLKPDNRLEAGYFYRSDHLSFAQRGVPAITLGSGRTLYEGGQEQGDELSRQFVSHHYHQPSDEWSASWDLRGQALDLHLLYEAGRAVADSSVWPQWRESSEFKAVRDLSSAWRQWNPLRPPTF
jgi:Zn-dependent M28 family amino/carboxypeptidase